MKTYYGFFLSAIAIILSCQPATTPPPNVYAGGSSNNSLGVELPGYWKNGAWNLLAPIDATKDSCAYGIAVE
jgi:hypothetical protein